MAIIRACTYPVAIQTPEDPNNYNQILVMFAQGQNVIIRKEKNDLQLNENGIWFALTQDETALFKPSKESPVGNPIGPEAYLQVRVYKSDTDAPGSECWKLDVVDSLSDDILVWQDPEEEE